MGIIWWWPVGVSLDDASCSACHFCVTWYQSICRQTVLVISLPLGHFHNCYLARDLSETAINWVAKVILNGKIITLIIALSAASKSTPIFIIESNKGRGQIHNLCSLMYLEHSLFGLQHVHGVTVPIIAYLMSVLRGIPLVLWVHYKLILAIAELPGASCFLSFFLYTQVDP